MIKNGQKYLITTSGWFYGPDGSQYRAAWGVCEAVSAKQELGFEPRHGTNWFVRVGEGSQSVIIAGCQIHYAVLLEVPPYINPGTVKDKESGFDISCNAIYIPGRLSSIPVLIPNMKATPPVRPIDRHVREGEIHK